jgi:hypothetical protein
MKKPLIYALVLSAILFINACGEKNTQEKETVLAEQAKNEISKDVDNSSDNISVSELAKNSDIQLEFNGFIVKKYNKAIDVMAQEMFKNGPLLITITFESPENGGGSLSFAAPKFEQGVYEMTGEPMKAASLASDKYIFKSQSGVLNITTISDEFIEGNVSDIVFAENTNFDAGNLKLVSGSFKIPLKKK